MSVIIVDNLSGSVVHSIKQALIICARKAAGGLSCHIHILTANITVDINFCIGIGQQIPKFYGVIIILAGSGSSNANISDGSDAAALAKVYLSLYSIIAENRIITASNIKNLKAAILLRSCGSHFYTAVTGSTV